MKANMAAISPKIYVQMAQDDKYFNTYGFRSFLSHLYHLRHVFTCLKEKFIFWNKDVPNINVDFFLSFFYQLQFDDRWYIFSRTSSPINFGVVYCYVQGASGTY